MCIRCSLSLIHSFTSWWMSFSFSRIFRSCQVIFLCPFYRTLFGFMCWLYFISSTQNCTTNTHAFLHSLTHSRCRFESKKKLIFFFISHIFCCCPPLIWLTRTNTSIFFDNFCVFFFDILCVFEICCVSFFCDFELIRPRVVIKRKTKC